VRWDDGLGLYRLRTTSRNSIRNLRAALQHVSSFTGGQIAGVPFDLALDYRDVSGPDGSRRNVPVWTFVMAPPGGLTSRTFAPTLRQALHEGQLLQIAPPSLEGEGVAEADFYELGDDEVPMDAVTDEEVALVARGGRCDAKVWEARWFQAVKGTRFDNEAGRAAFITAYTSGGTGSLSWYLAHASEAEANALIAAVDREIEDDRTEARRLRLTDQEHAPQGTAALHMTGVDDSGARGEPSKAHAPVSDSGYEQEPEAASDGPLFEAADERLEALAKAEAEEMPTQDDIDAYVRGLELGGKRDIDLEPFQIDGRESRKALLTLGAKLKAAIDVETQARTRRRA
jgi:hypothetical protein